MRGRKGEQEGRRYTVAYMRERDAEITAADGIARFWLRLLGSES